MMALAAASWPNYSESMHGATNLAIAMASAIMASALPPGISANGARSSGVTVTAGTAVNCPVSVR